MKILIVGLGGVGGYNGGMLARKYANNPDIQVDFLVRGEHMLQIRKHGLKVIAETETFVAHPHLATDNASEIGIADYIVMCTKSYDLEQTIAQIKPCVGTHTVIMSLLNGVGIYPIIRSLLPDTEVWEGCTYIVGRKVEPGVVQSSGGVHDVFFGFQNTTSERLLQMERIWQEAGIEAVFSPEILNVIWKKYFFISTTASLTSYFDVSFGALLSDPHRKATLVGMLSELLLIAQAEGIPAEQSWADRVLPWLERLPFATTSSMHTDFTNKYKTEVENLTGTAMRLAQKHDIDTPIYNKVYAALSAKMEQR